MTDTQTATPAETGDTATPDMSTKEAADKLPTEPSDALDSDATKSQEPKKPDSRDKKLAELAYRERDLRRQNARLLTLLEQNQAAETKPAQPKLDDHGSLEEYTRAAIAYDKMDKAPTKPVASDLDVSRDELFINGSAKHKDFADVMNAGRNITPDMAAAVFELDDPDIQVDTAYYLGRNPKESARIASLSPIRQIAEVTRLANKLEAKRESQEIRPSAAPEPIKPVGGTKTPSDVIQDTEPFESFLKKWRKQRGR